MQFEEAFHLSVEKILQGNREQAHSFEQCAQALYDSKKHADFFSVDGYKKYIVHKTANYTLEFYKWQGIARGIVAAFDTVELTVDDPIFSRYYINNQQLDIVALRRNHIDYYYEDISQAYYKALTAAIFKNYNKTFAYGTSLAGYCALYLGAVIPSVQILAFSPRNLGKQTYKQFPIVSAPVTLLLDVKNATDARFYEKNLKNTLLQCTFLALPYAGHRVPLYLKEVGQLRHVFEQFFAEQPITLEFPRSRRYESAEYMMNLARRLRRHQHYKWALQASEHALRLAPSLDRALYEQALILHEMGDVAAAITCLEEAIEKGTTLLEIPKTLALFRAE